MLAKLRKAHADGGLTEIETLRGLTDAAGSVQLPDHGQQFKIDICHNRARAPRNACKMEPSASIVPGGWQVKPPRQASLLGLDWSGSRIADRRGLHAILSVGGCADVQLRMAI